MKSSRLLLLIAIALTSLFTLTVSTATAGGMGNGAAQRNKLVVDSVDAAAGTIVLKSENDQSVHTYKIDGTTHVMLVNAKGTLDQVKVGMKVYKYSAAGGNPKDGDTLTVLGVSPAPAAK